MLRLLMFYVPLGTSSLLAALTHVIINGVLARSDHPDITISSYAVALSFSFLLDLPMNIIRQASGKYARDQKSFRAVARLTTIVAVILLTIAVLVGWSPLGTAMFHYLFGVQDELVISTVQVFQVLAFTYVFTALRGLYQGVIINQLRTGWMTVGMAIRVVAMFGMSWYFIKMDWTNDGRIGASVFVVGLIIETFVSAWEGWNLKKKLPARTEGLEVERVRHLLPFYMPLLYSSMVVVLLNPSIQASLNASMNPTMAVAAYAVALQLANLVSWFCMSVHQLVLQFYEKQKRDVILMTAGLSVLSPLVLLGFASDAGSHYLLESVLGVHGQLLSEVRVLLCYLSVQSALFPWLDFLAGKAMIAGRTKAVMAGKIFSVIVSIGLLVMLVMTAPQLNGAIAGIVTAAVAPFELLVVWLWIRKLEKRSALMMTGASA